MRFLKKVGEYIVYRKDVYKILEIKEKYANGKDYYRLVPIDDESLHVDIPAEDNPLIRDLISKEEVERIIKEIPNIEVIECEDKLLENEYKTLLNTNALENYVRIIKTTYLRNKEREANKKKMSDKDNHYFELAEKYLYNEFSIVLNKTFEETKNYVIQRVSALE